MAAGAKGERPTVCFSPVIGNEADDSGRCEVCNQGVARRDQGGIYPTQTNTSADKSALFHAGILGDRLLLLDFDNG